MTKIIQIGTDLQTQPFLAVTLQAGQSQTYAFYQTGAVRAAVLLLFDWVDHWKRKEKVLNVECMSLIHVLYK